MGARIALVFVDELEAELRFCFYDGTAYKRVLTADVKVSERELADQEEYKQDAWNARELRPVERATPTEKAMSSFSS